MQDKIQKLESQNDSWNIVSNGRFLIIHKTFHQKYQVSQSICNNFSFSIDIYEVRDLRASQNLRTNTRTNKRRRNVLRAISKDSPIKNHGRKLESKWKEATLDRVRCKNKMSQRENSCYAFPPCIE